MTLPPVTPVPLLAYPEAVFTDYRFAISPDGTQITFERSAEP